VYLPAAFRRPRNRRDAVTGVSNERESLETDPEFQSSDRMQNATFAADLLRRYYGESRMLGVREVAERLRVCTATVYKLCASGALEHVRVVNSIRVREHALAAFVAASSRSRNTRSRRP